MAHKLDRGGVGRGGVAVRCVLLLAGLVFVFCFVRRPSPGGGSHGPMSASCPPCVCDCSSESASILTMPFDGFNDSFTDCGKNDPAMSEEMEKDIVALLSEEVTLQKNVMSDTFEHTQELIMSAKRISSHYQNEAEKCTAGVEACEGARERAEASLRKERKLSEIWEERARKSGWTLE